MRILVVLFTLCVATLANAEKKEFEVYKVKCVSPGHSEELLMADITSDTSNGILSFTGYEVFAGRCEVLRDDLRLQCPEKIRPRPHRINDKKSTIFCGLNSKISPEENLSIWVD